MANQESMPTPRSGRACRLSLVIVFLLQMGQGWPPTAAEAGGSPSIPHVSMPSGVTSVEVHRRLSLLPPEQSPKKFDPGLTSLSAAPAGASPSGTDSSAPATGSTPTSVQPGSTSHPPAPGDHREHIASVSGAQDLRSMLTTTEFWPRLAALAPEESPAGSHTTPDPASVPLLKYYFFAGGALFPNLGHPTLAMEHETVWPAGRGYLGKTYDPKHYFVIGTDIHLDPVLMPTDGLSDRYYPRREGDWLLDFYLSSYVYGADVAQEFFPDTVTNFAQRSRQLADYILYSQYDINGDNAFCHDNYLADYPGIEKQAQTQRWQFGFDDLFDAPWTDLSGYGWSPHEPDLGVNAGSQVLALLRAWETLGDKKYLDAARSFLLYQVPRHGFHTGLWKGRRYYWLSATPELETVQGDDPVNSVEAMVAAPLAVVGYYTRDRAMLELARGLLWYLCREWTTNGRWYYEGQENNAIQRDHPLLSQEAICGAYSVLSLPYLIAAGTDVSPEIGSLTPAIHFLVTHRPDSYPVENSEARYIRSYLAFGRTRGLRPGNSILLRTFIQITGGGFSGMKLKAKLPGITNRPEQLNVVIHHGADSSSVKVPVNPDGSFEAPVGAAPYKPWDLYTVDVSAVLNARFTVDEFPLDKPTITLIPDGGTTPVTSSVEVQDYHYQTRLNAQNFLEAPQYFYFPHSKLRQ